jgi:hypothetical protein
LHKFLALIQCCCDPNPSNRCGFEDIIEKLEMVKEKGNEKQRETIMKTEVYNQSGDYT